MTLTPSARIWALVSGLPKRHQKSIRLAMLQVYLDASGTGQPPVIVLAGFIATAPQWSEFSSRWDEVLQIPLRLEYVKMDEAMRLDGEFKDWSEERRDERLLLLDRIIRDCVIAGVACILPYDAFERVIRKNPFAEKTMKSRYYFTFLTLVRDLCRRHDLLGIDDIFEFHFDEEVMEKTKIIEAWENLLKEPQFPRNRITGFPYFSDDKFILPLQAADICAWVTRQRWREENEGFPRLILPWERVPPKKLKILRMQWDEYSLWNLLKDIAESEGKFVSYTFGNIRGIA